jgi:hypothetical protein
MSIMRGRVQLLAFHSKWSSAPARRREMCRPTVAPIDRRITTSYGNHEETVLLGQLSVRLSTRSARMQRVCLPCNTLTYSF